MLIISSSYQAKETSATIPGRAVVAFVKNHSPGMVQVYHYPHMHPSHTTLSEHHNHYFTNRRVNVGHFSKKPIDGASYRQLVHLRTSQETPQRQDTSAAEARLKLRMARLFGSGSLFNAGFSYLNDLSRLHFCPNDLLQLRPGYQKVRGSS